MHSTMLADGAIDSSQLFDEQPPRLHCAFCRDFSITIADSYHSSSETLFHCRWVACRVILDLEAQELVHGG
jgi:hypothetical protein